VVTTNTQAIPSSFSSPAAGRFWLAAVLTGVSTGLGAIVLTRLLEAVQKLMWGGTGRDMLASAQRASAQRHVWVMLAAGVLVGVGQIVLKQLTSANGIDITAAIWFHAGRLPAWRTLGSALLSILVVGMGVSLGREGAPKQAGAVFANFFCDKAGLSDEQRRLLVACAAGAGMSAAYGVPLGGAIFSIEVMRGILALRYVLPALVMSLIATGVSWILLPDAPTYVIPAYGISGGAILLALLMGPIAGLASVGYVRLIAWADRNKPHEKLRVIAPAVVLGLMGVVSIWFPQILGNGKDIAQILFTSGAAPGLVMALLILKPAATVMCIRSGTPGGLFTPSLSAGALLGALLGFGWSWLWPGVPAGQAALLGAGAVLAATTQGPVSAVILMMELTGRDRGFILPLLVAVCGATLVARSIEPRSIYDARLTDKEVAARQKVRELPQGEHAAVERMMAE
jgi:H+/Cl- antiporter ClcA